MITLFKRFGKFSKIPIWILSVILAILFWVNNKMVNVYNYSYNIPIEYNELPNNLTFKKNPPKNFNITIQETGKKLFDIIFENRLDSVYIKVSKNWKNGDNYIIVDKKDINWQDMDRSIYHYLNKNSFVISLDSLATKQININPHLNLKIDKGLILVGTPEFLINRVEISGAKSTLSKINIANIDKNETEITQAGIYDYKFKLENIPDVTLLDDSISVKIEIQKKVSKVIDEIPVKIINSTDNTPYTTNYQAISVVVEGGKKVLKDITRRDFNVFIDFSTLDLKDKLEVTPKITSFKEIESMRSYPQKIKIIRKKDE